MKCEDCGKYFGLNEGILAEIRNGEIVTDSCSPYTKLTELCQECFDNIKVKNRGGKRVGAGRKKSDNPRVKTSITIKSDDKEWLNNREEKTSELIDLAFILLREKY